MYCNDFGGSDITDSMEISNDIGNTLLSAYVWKYSGFINSITIDKKIDLLSQAEKIFIKKQYKRSSCLLP